MNRNSNQIGISQRIRLEWLEQTANLVLAGNEQNSIKPFIDNLLKDKVSIGGSAERSNREKTITILMKIWFNLPPGLIALRDQGLDILKRLPLKERIAVHWGMTIAVYPFWAAVATHVGRFLKLQGTAVGSHIQRRLREQFGERETVTRAAQRVIRSFVDWGVLEDTGNRGVYRQGQIFPINDPELITWLMEASLHALFKSSAAPGNLVKDPCLFPFRIMSVPLENLVKLSKRLELVRHGLDEELIILK